MSLLIKSQATGKTMVELPQGALEYVGFSAYRLAAGEHRSGQHQAGAHTFHSVAPKVGVPRLFF